jgi:hypothetical protein
LYTIIETKIETNIALEGIVMNEKELKAYINSVVEEAFKEGVLYERNRVKLGLPQSWLAMELAITNTQDLILGA